MNINAFSVVFLIGIGLQGSASAATIPDTTNSAPSIRGHDAHSRFLDGAYTPGQQLSDDGFPYFMRSSSAGPADAQTLLKSETTPSSLILPQAFPGAAASSADSFIKTLNTIRTGGDRATQSFDELSMGGLGGAPSLSTVPLPAAAPLFGAALLILGGLGYRSRGRASRQA